jgi:hypothetical protein
MAFVGYLATVLPGTPLETLAAYQLDAQYASFRTKMTNDGASAILAPPLPPGLR